MYTTPINGWDIPELGDALDIEAGLAFMDDVDTRLVPRFANAAARNAAITSPVDGQLAYCEDTNELYIYNNSLWQGAATRGKYKTSATSRASTTTATADPDLVLPVEANCIYAVRGQLLVAAGTTGDFKYTTVGPTSYVQRMMSFIYGNDQPLDAKMFAQDMWIEGETPSFQCAGTTFSSQGRLVEMYGILITSGTAGNFSVDWAQITSDVTATTLHIGSWMTLQKVS